MVASNRGFSRKEIAKKEGFIGISKQDPEKEALRKKTLGEELLEPTTIYVKQIKSLLSRYKIAGMVHITGGGK